MGCGNPAPQTAPQATPFGALVTDPLPVVVTVSCRTIGANVAVTDRARSIVS